MTRSNERHGPLVSVETTAQYIDDPKWVTFDVRYDLMNPDSGPKQYTESHIPGAIHAHVDHHLSSSVGDGRKGRHPLPDVSRFQEFLQANGVDDDSQVVCYDGAGGMWAARLWWLLRYHGHEAVAVLDGGLPRWQSQNLPMTADESPARESGNIHLSEGGMPTIGLDAMAMHASGDGIVVDARAPDRYAGEFEPIDPVSGHIPGAINLPFAGNLRDDGRFLAPDELAARYDFDGPATMYCGSGVTAAHNVLAMDIAGLAIPSLSPDSWSAWSTQGRPAATGSSP
jgi:thiosulfate/3-mercaptopyruvate sulfurtransferase